MIPTYLRRPFLGKKKTTLIANGERLSIFKCSFTQVGTTFLHSWMFYSVLS